MNQSMEYNVLASAIQESHQTKLMDITLQASLCKEKLKNQQRLSRISTLLLLFTIGLKWMRYSTLALNFLINVMILFFYDADNNDIKELDTSKQIAIYFFGSCQITLSILIIGSYTLKNLPAFTSFNYSSESSKFTKAVKKKVLNYRVTVYGSLLFWIIYAGVSIYGIINWRCYSLLLLYSFLCFPLLSNVCFALIKHSLEIIQVILGIIVVTYIYSIFGYKYLRTSFETTQGINNCNNLYNCFALIFSRGLRSFGGIGDALMDDMSIDVSEDYWGRYWYDLTSFLVINCLLLCLIWIIAMDIIRQAQKQRNTIKSSINNMCHICGISKFDIETKGKGWENHIRNEHSIADYICYLIYLEDKNPNELTSLELYVKKRKEENRVDYFPIGKSRTMIDINKPKENVDDIKGLISELTNQFQKLKDNLKMDN